MSSVTKREVLANPGLQSALLKIVKRGQDAVGNQFVITNKGTRYIVKYKGTK